MFIHLGKGVLVRTSEVIGIFDIDNTTVSKYTKEFLNESEQKNEICDLSIDIPKSFVISNHCGKNLVFISQISSKVLKSRSDFFYK